MKTKVKEISLKQVNQPNNQHPANQAANWQTVTQSVKLKSYSKKTASTQKNKEMQK